MLDPVRNFCIAEMSAGYDAAATTVVLASGKGVLFPDPATDGAFNGVWWRSDLYSDPSKDPNVEIVRVTARTTDTLTVTRAQEGTSASTKNTAGGTYSFMLTLTAKMITDIGASGGVPSLTVLFSETVTAGQIINLYSNAGTVNARKADCTDNTKPAHGFVKAGVTSGQNGIVSPLVGDNSYVSGLTVGTIYFLSTAGGITATAPSTAGNIVQQLGMATVATVLWLNPGDIYEIS